MQVEKVNFKEKFAKFSDHWAPRVIAEMNDYQFKLVKLKGEFTWHDHKDTDEVFVVIKGSMVIEFREHEVKLSAGEMLVVPKGVEHKPHADEECEAMIIEPRGITNTGEADSDLTANNDVWI